MKVTINNVNRFLWQKAKHDAIDEKKTMGEIVNEGLALRQKARRKRARTRGSEN